MYNRFSNTTLSLKRLRIFMWKRTLPFQCYTSSSHHRINILQLLYCCPLPKINSWILYTIQGCCNTRTWLWITICSKITSICILYTFYLCQNKLIAFIWSNTARLECPHWILRMFCFLVLQTWSFIFEYRALSFCECIRA